tara:strand:+ start:255 stop:1127 length:873 start_codon:yes stop_codon:yes gene_type:complete
MGLSGAKCFACVAIGLIGAVVNLTEAAAGNRLYDMSRFLEAPHPYAVPNAPRGTAMLRPAVQGMPIRAETPLPGSQYRLQIDVRERRPLPEGATENPPATQAPVGTGSRPIVAELVIGGWIHDPGANNTESDSADLNLEIIFRKVTFVNFENRYLKFLFSPHPVLGGSVNSDNETHTAYLALNWQHQFENRWFLAGSFGFAYHTGNLHQAVRTCQPVDSCKLPGNRSHYDNGEVTLGSRILFRESIELGYRLAGRHGISLYLAHMSNATLFDDDNEGMNFAGLRYRYAFD